MCSCCCDTTEEKDYEKEKKTQGMGSADLQRKRENGVSYLTNQMRIDNREQYFK